MISQWCMKQKMLNIELDIGYESTLNSSDEETVHMEAKKLARKRKKEFRKKQELKTYLCLICSVFLLYVYNV